MSEHIHGVCQACGRPLALASVCKDCGNTFSISADEQLRYATLHFNLPRRCGACREIRRKQKRTVAQQGQ